MNTATLMTFEQATEKHNQLKTIHSLTRALLLEMRDKKGYLALGFSTFEEYGEKEWGYTRTYIYRIAQAEETQQSISRQIGDKEIPEGQLRPLAKITAKDRDAIYQKAKDEAEVEGKKLTAKKIEEAVAKYQQEKIEAEKIIKQQGKNLVQVVTEHKKLVDDFNELEASIDAKAEVVAEEKLKIKTTELQATLNAKVATVESEYQQTIDSQKNTIDSLTSRIKGIEQTSCTTEKDKELLADLRTQIDQAHAALQTLTIDQKEAHAAKRANHAYTGIAKALSDDVHDYIENMNSISHLVDNNGNAISLYPLTDDSKDFLQEVSRVLRNAATFIDNLAIN